MKNRIASILTAMVVLLSSCVPVIATPMTTAQAAQALTASSDRISMDTQGDGIRYHLYQNENKQWDKFLNNSINTTFRACNIRAVYTMITYHTNTEDNSTEYIINKASLDALALHQDTVDEWAHFVTTQLLPDGTDRNTVLKLCYLHIARNYAYDREIVANDDRGKQLLAQDAYYMITTGKAICASYARAFRALVEAVPFNKSTGLVDWASAEPDRIKVAIIEDRSVRHAWNAIQDPDGTWFYYDLTYEDPESLDTFHMSESMIHKYPSNWGTAQTNEWNY